MGRVPHWRSVPLVDQLGSHPDTDVDDLRLVVDAGYQQVGQPLRRSEFDRCRATRAEDTEVSGSDVRM
jgi:hypothetical protein